jgi:hypothetical protein
LRLNLLSKYIEKEESNGQATKPHNESLNNNEFSLIKSPLKQIPTDSKLLINSFNIKDSEEENELEMHKHDIQCELNLQGASDLVVDLFMIDTTNKVFKENVLLAIAMLEGGNTQVQVKIIYITKTIRL